MPSVDVSSLITGLNPIRHTSSYTMPVLSPRHGTSSLTGSYRSTFSSSSIDRPYTNSYSPRSYSYSERYTSRSYTSDDGKKSYSRHSSITDDLRSYREEARETSVKRDSVRSNSLRDYRDSSLTRAEARNSRSDISSMSVLDSVADLRSRYSPANYIPSVRKTDYGRSKSIGSDIGKPPIEAKTVKLKKVINENVCNSVALTNNTNKIDNNDDTNGNRTSVAEIRKKFDPNYCNRKLYIEGVSLKTQKTDNKPNITNDKEKRISQISETETHMNTKLYIGRPPKFSKTTVQNQEVENAEENVITEETTEEAKNEDVSAENVSWTVSETSNMDVETKNFNHTTNFASYIPSKDNVTENEAMNEGGDSDMESTENTIQEVFCQRSNVSINFCFLEFFLF